MSHRLVGLVLMYITLLLLIVLFSLQGWGLYAEDLGNEMGMYTEKYSLYVTLHL